MKQKKLRLFGLLLAAAMLLGCLPVQALAAEGGWFYLVADWNGTLLIAPERVSYTADQTLYEALNASGHSFGPDENSVTQIDGKTGNFIRSDETGSHDLTRNAAQAGIRYLCFTDRLTAQPSDAMQSLIAAMADYRLEEPDVQLAAQAAYNAACADTSRRTIMRRSACTRRFITRSSSTSRRWTAQNITLPSRTGTAYGVPAIRCMPRTNMAASIRTRTAAECSRCPPEAIPLPCRRSPAA